MFTQAKNKWAIALVNGPRLSYVATFKKKTKKKNLGQINGQENYSQFAVSSRTSVPKTENASELCGQQNLQPILKCQGVQHDSGMCDLNLVLCSNAAK